MASALTAVAAYNGVSTGNKTEWDVSGLEAGETYSFRVQAVNGGELSAASAECVVTLPVSTGINTVENGGTASAKQYYNLAGIRMAKPQKGGVYIVRQGTRSYKETVR